ncbi:MAG: phage integrase N-terminal SAM-like domain-containing protein [Deltaproteobacteria bacterium]|nr:phage integrase N-terminal SAM-like domain-containing protein [Deltaproteobacteria bacterium]
MLKTPPALAKKYDRLLINSDIPPDDYYACRKWLRFYLDFCKKYEHGYADNKSLILFVEKLNSKNQNSFQKNQAQSAVNLYYSGIDKKTSVPISAKEYPAPADLVMEGSDSIDIAEENNPWDVSINKLKNKILTRHYSKKTLKAYSLWAEKLRYFAKDKEPDTLTIDDAKDFLTFFR